MKKLHRGPTILLTLVPALAAGLAIGLIINAVQQASQYKVTENDKNYLAEINALSKGYGTTYSAPHKVIMSLKNNGYDVLTHKFSNANFELAFDASVKQFILMYGDRILATPDGYEMTNSQVVFKFTNSYDKDSKYGQYLLDDYSWDNPEDKFEIKASIDVGNNTNIKYMEYVPDNSNASATKFMRTYCEYLVFPANNDTIFHMGESNNIEVYGTSATAPCNYMELGKTSYLYVQNTALQVAKINTADTAQIDVLEVSTVEGSVVTKGELFHPEFITMLIGKEIEGGSGKTLTEITEVDSFKTLGEKIDANAKFIRLTKSFSVETETEPVTSALSINDKQCIIDLNQFTITDNSSITAGESLINITATSSETSLMFIDSWRKGTIILKDHYITVLGDKTNGKTATLYLNGANFEYSATTERNGAIVLGSKDSTSSGKQYSRIYMYGGKIDCNTETPEHEVAEVAGIYAFNDALIQIYYGAIYSNVNCVRTNGNYSGSTINISDGTFKTKPTSTGISVGECVYLPRGVLNISGGTFEGHTCIGMRGGEANITGGYLHATGNRADLEKQGSGSGINGDGSVICVKLSQASASGYGLSLKINVTNGTLHSENSYILQVFRDNPSTSTTINQYLDVSFIDGVYYYGHEAEGFTYNGVRVASAENVPASTYKIQQNGGSWIKIEK